MPPIRVAILATVSAACTFSLPEPRGKDPSDAATEVDVDAGDASAGTRADMVRVPAGVFLRGCNEPADTGCFSSEKPSGSVTISRDYEIDRTEVSQEAYERCVKAGACSRPSNEYDPVGAPALPVRWVTWAQARDYCAWNGKRLPTEAEWEKAARGSDGRIYAWGNDAPTCERTTFDGCGPASVVGSHPTGASPYGALDMTGNVSEWVNDWYALYPTGSVTDPTGPASGSERVFRGGSWDNTPRNLRASVRGNGDPSAGQGSIGIRCAR